MDGRIIDPQQETSSVTGVPLTHAGELFAAEGMKRVRDEDSNFKRGG